MAGMWALLRPPLFRGAKHANDYNSRSRNRQVGISGAWLRLQLRLVFVGMGLFPKLARYRQGVDGEPFPPGHLVASLMQLAVMTPAEWHGELVADLDP